MSEDPTPTATPDPTPPEAPATARIQTLVSGVRARGFTFARGKVVAGLSLAFAEKLERDGEVKILDITPLS